MSRKYLLSDTQNEHKFNSVFLLAVKQAHVRFCHYYYMVKESNKMYLER